jgi:hypothetical protein
MAVLRPVRFTIDPADTAQKLTRHAVRTSCSTSSHGCPRARTRWSPLAAAPSSPSRPLRLSVSRLRTSPRRRVGSSPTSMDMLLDATDDVTTLANFSIGQWKEIWSINSNNGASDQGNKACTDVVGVFLTGSRSCGLLEPCWSRSTTNGRPAKVATCRKAPQPPRRQAR